MPRQCNNPPAPPIDPCKQVHHKARSYTSKQKVLIGTAALCPGTIFSGLMLSGNVTQATLGGSSTTVPVQWQLQLGNPGFSEGPCAYGWSGGTGPTAWEANLTFSPGTPYSLASWLIIITGNPAGSFASFAKTIGGGPQGGYVATSPLFSPPSIAIG